MCAKSVQKFGGKEEEEVEENNMKRTNGVTAVDGTLLLCALQAGFDCAVIFNTLKEDYLCPWIALCHHHLASFTKAC